MNKNWTEENIDNFLSRIRFDFITQLEKKMESIPLTQVELAKKLGVTEGSVSQILNNPSNLTLKTIVKYARTLGLKVSIIAYDDGDPHNNRGLINSEIFAICWERQGKPVDFFELEEKTVHSLENLPTSTNGTDSGVLAVDTTNKKVSYIADWKAKSSISTEFVADEDSSTTNTVFKKIA
jgi:transcriptional regulator with XRE-family HTH domain